MDEQNIFLDENAELQESEDVGLDMTKSETDINVLETVDTVDVDVTEDIVYIIESENDVDVDSAFPPLGDQEDIIWHSKLPDINNKDQHPMWAITGLEEKFAEIESIKQIHSNKENIAHYYRWADENPDAEDRSGCFVSFVENTNYIEISDTDVVGVTVRDNEAAFLGNDTQDGRNAAYGLVCVSGIVPIRTLSDVQAGDKVVPDIDGRAKKSTNDYGYRVIEIREELTERYAVVALIPETVSLVGFKEDVVKLDEKLDSVQKNTIVAINAANEALKQSLTGQINQIGQQASSAIEIANGAQNTASNAQNIASGANMNSALAKEMAQSAQSTIKSIKQNVEENLSAANDSIEELMKSVEPITTWEQDGNKGAEYFVQHIENDLATKTYVTSVDTKVDNAYTAIHSNAKGIQSLALVEYKYSVGTHSPSYGMSLSEAQETLKVGMVYVPTVDTTETAQGSVELFKFYRGNSYTWNGISWTESTDEVALLNSYVTGDDSIKYWFVDGQDVIEGDITYPADTLCKWIDGKWMVVASTKDVSASWVASRIYQTANSLGSEIATANGEITQIKQDIEDVTASISLMATSGDTAALIEAIANGVEVKINNAAIYNGASLVSRTDMNESPTGEEFYAKEPEWDQETSSWNFGDTSFDKPIYPCWAKFYDENGNLDGTKYYKYSKKDRNNWVMFIYKYTNNFSGISQKVDANEANISLVVSMGAVEDGTPSQGVSLIAPYYTQLPSWENNKWVVKGSSTTSTDSPPYYKINEEGSQCWKYTNPIKDDNDNITWTCTSMKAGNTIDAASIVMAVNNSGSEINMSADRIKLNGGTINMAANQFTIEAGNGFRVTPNGAITATAGDIGGWKISENSLYSGQNVADETSELPTVYIGNDDLKTLRNDIVSVSGADSYKDGQLNKTKKDWRLKVGTNFGVDKNGTLYANNGKFKGTIRASKYLDDKGKEMMTAGKWKADYLDVTGLNVGDGKLIIDSNGNITLKNGTITWDGGTPWTDYDDNDVESYLSSQYKITSTSIGEATIESPKIIGNEICAYGAFKALDKDGNLCGFYGTGYGLDAANVETKGVVLSYYGTTVDSNGRVTAKSDGYYVIVTERGIRLQVPGHKFVITSGGIFYDDSPLITGSSSGTAVFG